ncbi:hypothetical protein HYT01_03015 [Candidatus Giovannonibacteria bacterium]|nr:hypothetical protein [Candidatus Giovannonibacteria bacterium]
MIYKDPLYGPWVLPTYLKELLHTKETLRTRGIAQASSPAHLLTFVARNRVQHGLGVARLMAEVVKHNRCDLDEELMVSSAFLHDFGNTPFSHLCEDFLQEMIGKNGETFLENILDCSETEKVLAGFGVASRDVVKIVAGQAKPMSDVLNGDIDVDNLDNILGFNKFAAVEAPAYDALGIAGSFRFMDGHWLLLGDCYADVQKWQIARRAAYMDVVYSSPHYNGISMLYRAVELALYEGEISPEFFRFSDIEAISYLMTCNPRTIELVDKMSRWKWYPEVASWEIKEPSRFVAKIAACTHRRRKLLDEICGTLGIAPEKICLAMQRGVETKRIKTPFLVECGRKLQGTKFERPPLRVRVFVSPEWQFKKPEIEAIISNNFHI